jgi:dolichol-phosphate mannosyltransferase
MPLSYPMRPLVIVPTYNERANLAQLIPAVCDIDRRLHILIVDDNSPDNTAGIVRSLIEGGRGSRLFLQSRPGKQGLGSAYVLGFKWGLAQRYDFMIQMDADFSHNPADLERMLRLARESNFVIASRYLPGGGTINWGFGRKMLSKSASVYSRCILREAFTDFTGGFNGWSGTVLQGIDLNTLRSDGYSFQIELKYRAARLGFPHVEFPIFFKERRAGKSKMSLSIALEACWRVWAFRMSWNKTIQVSDRPKPVVDAN